jgi:hypothetical protein
MTQTLISLIFSVSFYASSTAQQPSQFVQNPELSTTVEKPYSYTPYLIARGMDSVYVTWFSTYLQAFQEPIYYNHKFTHEQYRLLIIPAFAEPIIFIFVNKDQCEVITKKALELNPDNSFHQYVNLSKSDSLFIEEFQRGPTKDTARMSLLFKENSVMVKDTIPFRFEEWKIFPEQKVCKELAMEWGSLFESLQKETTKQEGDDGRYYVVEANTKNGYHFDYRWSPNKEYCPLLEKIGIKMGSIAKVKKR